MHPLIAFFITVFILFTANVWCTDIWRVMFFYIWKNVPQVGSLLFFYYILRCSIAFSSLIRKEFAFGFFMFWQGASTTCYAALHPDFEGVSGKYFLDCKESFPTTLASDPKLAKDLWEWSEKKVKLSVNEST